MSTTPNTMGITRGEAYAAVHAQNRIKIAAPAMLAALRAVLPYAESRLEDMEEHAREVADDPRLGPEADADVRKAREALHAAQAAIAAAEGRA